MQNLTYIIGTAFRTDVAAAERERLLTRASMIAQDLRHRLGADHPRAIDAAAMVKEAIIRIRLQGEVT
jgi:hypothetical protein